MNEDETPALFERVLEALHRAEGDSMALTAAFTTFDGETRAMALIRSLLAAEDALRATFELGEPVARDIGLAHRAALALATRTDVIEAAQPDRRPVRLSEMAMSGTAF
jgi:hypothetical protein